MLRAEGIIEEEPGGVGVDGGAIEGAAKAQPGSSNIPIAGLLNPTSEQANTAIDRFLALRLRASLRPVQK